MRTHHLVPLLLLSGCGAVETADVGPEPLAIPTSNAQSPVRELELVDYWQDPGTVAAGGTVRFGVTLRHTSCAMPVAGRQLFVHLVHPDRPAWFDFAVYPVPAPPSEQWANQMVIEGTMIVPQELHGTFQVQVGVNDGSTSNATQNMALGFGSTMTETFGDGAIGYRYVVGTLVISERPATGDGDAQAFARRIIEDMTLPNDGALAAPQARGAGVQMGLIGRADQAPTYWPWYDDYASSGWWTALVPWWNVYPLENNQSEHTRIETGYGVTYARSGSAWFTVGDGFDGWAGNYNWNASSYLGPANEIAGSAPGHKAYLPPASPNTLHGGNGNYYVEPWTIDALVVCTWARLVVDAQSGIDDRYRAHFAMWMGADWKPTLAGFPGGIWGPAVATSRLKEITNAWQMFCVAPLDDPGRPASELRWFVSQPDGLTFSADELLASPPPVPRL